MEDAVHRVTIERIVQGGDGMARLPDGRVVWVPGVLPGEEVFVRVTSDHESYARGAVEQIVESSDVRVEPDCMYADECGGCQFWHTDPGTQFDLKVKAAEETLERVAGLSEPEIERVASESHRRYRTHATFHRRRCDEEDVPAGEPPFQMGYFRASSNDLVAIDDCMVAVETVNEALSAIEPGLEEVGEADLLVETADASSCVVSVRILTEESHWEPPSTFADWGAELEDRPEIRGVRVLTNEREWVLGDPTVDADQCLADPPLEAMRVPAGMFRQANPSMNRKVVAWVVEQVRQRSVRSVLELFCGTGNISFGLRDAVERLVGLEVAEQAVQTANTMADFKQLDGFDFRRRDLASGTGEAVEANDGPFDAVILDPPRGGAEGVTGELTANQWMGRDVMVYVSCDPPALARDLDALTDGPWEIDELSAFDMFPMTSHLEMGAVLRRE